MDDDPQVCTGFFLEGADSYLREAPRGSCPHLPGSVQRQAWLDGWDQTAHRERHGYSSLSLDERR